MSIQLGVNIDHIATLRQQRQGQEPDPLRAAHEAELGGATIITVHLREDRRHIQDHDVFALSRFLTARLNLEMGATEEMLTISRRLRTEALDASRGLSSGVHMFTLVPEKRQELTTEGGLNVAGDLHRLTNYVARLKDLPGPGATVSAFIEADPAQVEASKAAGFDACEIHTGQYAAAYALCGGDFSRPQLASQLARLVDAGHRCRALGMRLHAGHALNYVNVTPVAQIPGMAELHIGHSIISRAAFSGLRQAVIDMLALLR
jgi:pyridoxine 5-phosphate synthase